MSAADVINLGEAEFQEPAIQNFRIPRGEIAAFYAQHIVELNNEAKAIFEVLAPDEQRKVLNSGPLNIFHDPMDMFKFRVEKRKAKEAEISEERGTPYVPGEATKSEFNDWIMQSKRYIGEEGVKQLETFSKSDQWRIITEGPAKDNMDPVHVIEMRAKSEMEDTVAAMFKLRREQANKKAEAEGKPLFNPSLAPAVQAFFTRVVGCEVSDTERRTGGFGVQHELEEDRTNLMGKVKGVDGVVEILKRKYECRKGERYRVIGERGGPGAGHWRLEKGKTIPKTHVKEGGWRWVLEEPEEETVVKPPPVATAPVETFTPKEQKPKKYESDEEAESPRKKEVSKRVKKKTAGDDPKAAKKAKDSGELSRSSAARLPVSV